MTQRLRELRKECDDAMTQDLNVLNKELDALTKELANELKGQ